MKNNRTRMRIDLPKRLLLIVFMLSLLITGTALSNDGYAINWWSVDGGGGRLTGGGYVLEGTSGQSDASRSENTQFTLAGGIWGHSTTLEGQDGTILYLPVVME